MKLHELPNGAKFTLKGDDSKAVFLFDHIDGAYSMCFLGLNTVHISANAEVDKVEEVENEKVHSGN